MAGDDAKTLIETAVRNFLKEVPALEPLKLVVGVELRARGDVQHYRLEMPGPKVTKGVAPDAKIRVEIPRAFFKAKATGIDQIMRQIVNVVERQEERTRTKKARS
jgi:hypothetical protein